MRAQTIHPAARHLVAAALIAALAGCSNAPMGSNVDDGSFGASTMNNTMLMTGQKDATVMLGERFAAEVPTTINFAFNSAQLTPEAAAVLRRQADWIRQFPEVRFRVYGHTDLVGGAAFNKALGLRRARATVAYLATQGISTTRLEAVVSYGKTQPLIPTPGPEERNRRTVTEVSGFVARNPTVMNGKYAEVVWREYVQGATRAHPTNTDITTQVDPSKQ